MFQSLRYQFLIPMVFAVIGTAALVTYLSKWAAEQSALQSTTDRLQSIASLCVSAPFPLTNSVLTQIENLTQLKSAVVFGDGAVQARSDGFPGDANGLWIKVRSQAQSQPSLEPLAAESEKTRPNTASKSNAMSDAGSVANPDTVNTNVVRYVQWQGKRYASLTLPIRSIDGNVTNAAERFLVLLESDARTDLVTRQAFFLPLITGICSAVVVALVATVVVTRIGRRIESLNKQVNTIASGSFDQIEPRGPHDAVFSLAESVNSMSGQLARSTAQIAQNERARLINLIASGLAHSLRNYLTGARLAIQTIDQNDVNREAVDIAVQQMRLAEESIQRLLAIRVDGDPARSDPMSLMQIRNQILELVSPIAKHHRVQFTMADFVSGACNDSTEDGNAIVGALLNLVMNAMEAAGPGGTVHCQPSVMQDADSSRVTWSIRDNGSGPSPEIMNTMFEPFATTKKEGVGIGLPMCERIAQRNGGSISWRRESGWTVFDFIYRVA